MSLVSLAVPFYYNPNPARVKRNEERIPFRPRRGRLGHLPHRGRQAGAPSLPLEEASRRALASPEGGSGRRPIGGSPSRKAGHHNSFLSSFLLSPAFAAAGSRHQPDAFGLRRRLWAAGAPDPLPHRLEAPQLLAQLTVSRIFRISHPPFPRISLCAHLKTGASCAII